MSRWQDEPLRSVHTLLYTTHHRAQCTLKVHRTMMLTVQRWQIWVGFLRSSLSEPLPLLLLSSGLFLSTVSPEIRHVCPGIQREPEMLNMHTSCRAVWFSLCSCSPFLTPLSVSLYLLHLLHPIHSQSLSINKSFLAGCSRLNQPLCKHGC